MPAVSLRLHRFLPFSRANGPGARAVLWTQGCSLACPSCFNPDTWSHAGGEDVPVDDLFAHIVALGDTIQGVTISGGEPLQQRVALLGLLSRLREETSLSILVFTGFTWSQVQRFPEALRLLACLDVLIAGPYEQKHHLALDLRGSANKTVHFLTNRYTARDLAGTLPAEVILTPTGEVISSGIDPLLVEEVRSP
jgi:anaerobic ribonucleoside-triphosphate reductase activating protein